MLVEMDKIAQKEKIVAELINNNFINIAKTLNLKSLKSSNSNDIMDLISQFNEH